MTQFTWKSGTDGLWGTASDWVGGVVPNSTTADVTITSGSAEIASGTSITVDLITLTSSAATLEVQGLLELGGTNDRLLVASGTLDVLGGGTIANGTIIAGSGTVSFSSGAFLEDITYLGNLNITAGQELDASGGLIVKTATGSLPGTINVGDNATFDTDTNVANETLNNMVINLGAAAGGAVFEHDLIGNGGVLTLGSLVTLNAIGANDRIYDDGGATIVNAGVINANGAGFAILGNSFANAGTINIAAGDSLTESENNFTGSGKININGGELILESLVSLASLGSISMTASGTLDAVGTLSLSGEKLGLTAGTLAGVIANGTLTAGTVTLANGINLEDITYLGNLNITAGQELDASGGLIVKTATGSLPGTINIGDNATFDTDTNVANETLNNMVINLGASAGAAVFEHDLIGNGGVLTLGGGVTLNAIGANDRIYDDGGATIVNAGVINVNGTGFVIQGNSFANAGTINIAAGDSLTESENNFTGSGKININGGELILESLVSLASLGSISMTASGTLDAVGTLSLSGEKLGLTAGTLAGVIANGTLTAGTVTLANGINLEDITYLGNLNITAGQELDASGGLIVKTATGSLPGTINVGDNATFDTDTNVANETLNNMVINLGAAAGGAVFEHDLIGNGGVLTLGSLVTLNAIGANDRIYDDGGATIVNAGVINVNGAGFVIQGNSFANAGTINIAAGDSLTESENNFTGSGKININGGELILESLVSLASLGSISMTASGTLDAVGTLSLSGEKLGLTAGTLAGVIANGTLKAGTVTLANGIRLEDITYLGNLNIAAGQELDASGGLIVKTATGSLPGTINIGDNATFDTDTNVANETLNNMVINLGASAGAAVFEHDLIGNGGVLTLGGGVTLNAIGANDRIYDDGGATIVNAGVINVNGAGFVIQGNSFANAGTINIAAGDSLTESENNFTNSGMIEGTGAGTVTVSLPASFVNLSAGKLSGGAFEANAGDTLALNLNSLFTTDDGKLILNGAGSEITEYNSTTNSYVSIESEVTTIGSGGALEVLAGRNDSISHTLDLSGGDLQLGGGTVTVAGLALSGAGAITGFGIVKANVTGNGKLDASGGTLDLSTDTIGFLTSTTLTSGDTLEADAAATLKLSNNKTITVDSGVITLSGTNSVIESLNTGTSTEIQIDTTLDDVTAGGVFNVLTGRSFTATANAGSFTNAGKLSLGGGTFTSTRLTEATGALLTGFGTVAGPISNAGTITASGGTLALTGSLAGAGTLSAAAGATLKLSLGGPFSEPITGAGTLELSGTTAYTLAGTLAVGTVKIDAGTTLSGSGTIQGNLADSGAVTASAGTLAVGGSVTGAGTLSTASGAVLDLKGGGSFAGALTGAGKIQIDSALTLNAGTSLSASSVLDNANVTLGSGAAITNAATHTYTVAAASGTTITVGGAGTFTNDGTLAATGAGTVDIDTTFINAASVSVGSGKMVFLSPVSGSGTVGIASGATAEFEAGAAATQNLSFLASAGELSLASPASFLGNIIGFTGADEIDLLNTAATKLTYSGNQLTVLNGTTTVATLNFSGAYSLNNFVLGSDNSGGSLITWQS